MSQEIRNPPKSSSHPSCIGWAEQVQQIKAKVQVELGPERFERWFSLVRFGEPVAGRVVLGVPSLFVLNWIKQRYKELLEQTIQNFGPYEVDFRIDSELNRQSRERVCNAGGGSGEARDSAVLTLDRPPLERLHSEAARPWQAGRLDFGPAVPDERSNRREERTIGGLHEDLTLDNYVVGTCNHVAFTAGMEVLREPGRSYNPLFVYGPSGVGKTHLLQGITREYFRQGIRRIRYLPCEEFVHRFVKSLREKSIDRFRATFYSLRVLVLDDVHVIQNKPKTQQELLQLIDTLASSGGQVILASDSRPHAIERLQRQLQGRFVSGLVCRVQPPDRATRQAILSREAKKQSITISGEVLDFVSERAQESVRELIGAFNQVTAQATLLGRPLSVDVAEEALGVPRRCVVGLEAILNAVASLHLVKAVDLLSRNRARAISRARQEAMYLARTLTSSSLVEIGQYFKRNHATVNFAVRKVERLLKTDENVAERIEQLTERLRGELEGSGR